MLRNIAKLLSTSSAITSTSSSMTMPVKAAAVRIGPVPPKPRK
jgi:hypothetical protein